jgi:hypothetical protein
MTSFSSVFSAASLLTNLYGFQDAKHLVDVGGGFGLLSVEILRLNPHLKGTSFDLVFSTFSLTSSSPTSLSPRILNKLVSH